MKRLSSFGFTPLSQAQSSQEPVEKRARPSQSVSDPSESSGDQPHPLPSLPERPQQLLHQPHPSETPQVQLEFVRSDVGTYSNDRLRGLLDEDRLWLLQNACRPDANYKYPQKEEYGKKRSFQHTWLVQFPWLSYSETCNGGFCIHCVLFAKHRLSLGQLVTTAMTKFTRAKVTLQEHSKQTSHKMASMDSVDFMGRMEKGNLSVYQLMQNEATALVQSNRQKIKSILKAIVFCVKQMIPLRGHREQAGTNINPGNFLALLDFRMDAGDVVLADHFKTAPQNAQYHSPRIQNDLILCTGEWIRNKIIQEVKNAKFFSVCADEAADCSNKEQLPLVLRFVDATKSIREEFVDFILCDTGTSGIAIADKILAALEGYGLNVSYLRGQAYDGAGNMSGKYRGAAATIQTTCPKAVYVHCAAHSLNLCVVAACNIRLVKNMMGTMVEICLFFCHSPKRQLELEKNVKSIPGATAKKLVSLCKTRWVARINALEVFFDLFPAVITTLEVISEGSTSGWNAESCRLAENLMTCLTKFQFLIAFVVTKECLGYIKGLTTALQKRALDICQAYSDVLKEVRENIDTKHKEWFDIAVALGDKVNASVPDLPRRCNRQTSRSNTPGDTPEVYYRRVVSSPFLDELIAHLQSRFSDIQQKAVMGLRIVPSVIMDDSLPNVTLNQLKDYYEEDLPNPSSLETELHLWKCKWRSSSQPLPDTPADALMLASDSLFPNIHCLLRLVCTIPVTSCECERSVSVLRRLKTYLRLSMGQDRLSGLALMHIQYGMEIDYDEVINIFARKHPRRMVLSDILGSDSDSQ